MSDNFGGRLRQFRSIRNWTQDDLAHKTEVSRRMVAAYESNETPPSYKFLEGIHRLGADIGALMTGTSTGIGVSMPSAQPQEIPANPLTTPESINALMRASAQYKAALDVISAALTAINPPPATTTTTVDSLNADEAAIIAAYRSATPTRKLLFLGLVPDQSKNVKKTA